MPTQEEQAQKQGFRSSLFGFDKDDVLAYLSALAEETQNREQEYRRRNDDLQAQVDKLQGDLNTARLCVDKLQEQLAEADKTAAEAKQKAEEQEQTAAETEKRFKANQETLVHLQFRCHELENQVRSYEQAAQAEADKAEPLPAPAESAADAPADVPPPAPDAEDELLRARIEARSILEDARLYAENAEQRLARQEREQQERMAEHARGLAAGMLLLRTRLARVDNRISAATLDLENATTAIYKALDAAGADLDTVSARMSTFGQGEPDDVPEPPDEAPPPPPARLRATAQAVGPRRRPRPTPPGRLRRPLHAGRPVSQELTDVMDHFPPEDE